MRARSCSERWLALAFLGALGLIAAWSALSGTPPGEVSLLPCPVLSVAGIPCPGCGMTRACVSLARLEPGAAWSHHPFAFLLLPLALCLAIAPAWTHASWARISPRLRSLGLGLGLASCLALWVFRLV